MTVRRHGALLPLIFAMLAVVLAAWAQEPGRLEDATGQPAKAAGVPMTPSWEVPVTSTPAPFLVGTDHALIIATRSGRMSAHDPASGSLLWEVDLASPLSSAPVFTSGRLAVPAGEGEQAAILLIDPATGALGSRIPFAGSAGLIVSATSSGIAVIDPAGSLVLIGAQDGSIRWRSALPSLPSAGAAQCGDALLVGGADGSLMALSGEDGDLRWRKEIGGPITTPVLCEGKFGYVGSADNRLHALKLRRGGCRIRWSYLTGGDIAGRVLLYHELLLFFSYDTYLYGLEADNGHLEWKVRLGRRPQPESILLGDLLLVAPLNTDRLEAFRLPAGIQAASLSLPGATERFVTPPARAGAVVAIAAARYGEETARVMGVEPPVSAAKPAEAGAAAGSSPP